MLDSLFGDVVTGTNDFIEKPVTAIPLVHDSK